MMGRKQTGWRRGSSLTVLVAAFTGTCLVTIDVVMTCLPGELRQSSGVTSSTKSRRDADAGISGLMILSSKPINLASRVRVAHPAGSRAQLGVVRAPKHIRRVVTRTSLSLNSGIGALSKRGLSHALPRSLCVIELLGAVRGNSGDGFRRRGSEKAWFFVQVCTEWKGVD